jgi:hypothetical protein
MGEAGQLKGTAREFTAARHMDTLFPQLSGP